jgi:hypothetical protein
LPGLYGPRAFLAGLDRAQALARAYAEVAEPDRALLLRAAHARSATRLEAQRRMELAALRLWPAAASTTPSPAGRMARADALAITKAVTETPLLGATTAGEPRPAPNDPVWRAIGLRHIEDARLSDRSRAIVAREARDAEGAVRRLEERIAEDTVRNELDLHARLHAWFAEGSAPAEIAALDARVYRELFLAADPQDPWAGLSPDDLFVGLPEGGRVTPQWGRGVRIESNE